MRQTCGSARRPWSSYVWLASAAPRRRHDLVGPFDSAKPLLLVRSFLGLSRSSSKPAIPTAATKRHVAFCRPVAATKRHVAFVEKSAKGLVLEATKRQVPILVAFVA